MPTNQIVFNQAVAEELARLQAYFATRHVDDPEVRALVNEELGSSIRVYTPNLSDGYAFGG